MTLEEKKAAILELCRYGDSIKQMKQLQHPSFAIAWIMSRTRNFTSSHMYGKKPKDAGRKLRLDVTGQQLFWLVWLHNHIDILKNSKEIEDCYTVNTPYCAMTYQAFFWTKRVVIPYTHADFTEYVQTCLDCDGNPIPAKEKLFCRNMHLLKNSVGWIIFLNK
jgi:hypothetical protein